MICIRMICIRICLRRGRLNQAGFSLIEMMMVVAVMGVLAAIAIPMSGNALHYLKLSGDARDLSNGAASAKMRAAAKFTQSRLYVDLTGKAFYVQTFNKAITVPCPTGCWVNETGGNTLSSTVSFGYGSVSTPPPNTQTTIGQAPLCYNTASPPVTVANTACIIFNSRGIPVDSTGSPIATDAVYLNDGVSVYGVTISATGFIRVFQSPYRTTPTWVQQ